jgi:hypothetical protein
MIVNLAINSLLIPAELFSSEGETSGEVALMILQPLSRKANARYRQQAYVYMPVSAYNSGKLVEAVYVVCTFQEGG